MNKYLMFALAVLISLPAYANTKQLIDGVKNKNITEVKKLLESGENVNGTNSQGNTAMHYAVATNNMEMVKLLLQHGADVKIENNKGWSAYTIAERKNVGNIYDLFKSMDTSVQPVEQVKESVDAEVEKVKEAADTVKNVEKKMTVTDQVSEKVEEEVKSVQAKQPPVVKAAPKSAKPTEKTVEEEHWSSMSDEVKAGDEEIIYCLTYLGLQGEQKSMANASSYFAIEVGIDKVEHDKVVAIARQYFENASEKEIKARAAECSKHITPPKAFKQNQIIRSLNRAMGY